MTLFLEDQPPLPTLHLRGATFSVNNKPCIVLTDYRGFYPTLWFALIHELFHVLFDWDEIITSCYHISDNESEQLSVMEKELEANDFAREYLFSKEKTTKIKSNINNISYINSFARDNHVHPSFIYVFYAYDVGKKDSRAWGRATGNNPDIKKMLRPLANPWDNPKTILEHVKSIKSKYYK